MIHEFYMSVSMLLVITFVKGVMYLVQFLQKSVSSIMKKTTNLYFIKLSGRVQNMHIGI